MNYLAHIYLSGSEPSTKVGGLLGDFVKGPLHGEWHRDIEIGIALHRKIDTYVDQLPEVHTALARFESPYRRFAGIYLDLCFDHFLAHQWQDYHHQPLARYCQDFYHQLTPHYEQLPARAKHFCDVAPKVGWLEGYATFSNLEPMLRNIGRRFKKPVRLDEGLFLLQRDYHQLSQEFSQLFPRVIAFADEQRQHLQHANSIPIHKQ